MATKLDGKGANRRKRPIYRNLVKYGTQCSQCPHQGRTQHRLATYGALR